MTIKPLPPEGQAFDPKQHGPLHGAVLSTSGSLKEMPDSQLANLQQTNADAAKQAGNIEKSHYLFLMTAKRNSPMLGENVGGARIAREIAQDYEHLRFAKKADAEGKLLAFKSSEDLTEVGVVSGDKGNYQREGLWTTVNKEGKRVHQGHFVNGVAEGIHRDFHADGKNVKAGTYYKAGVPEGSTFVYNEKSQPIWKGTYEGGKIVSETNIDPVQYNQEQKAKLQEKIAMNSIKFT